ncbi:hypothetical protein D3C85_1521590 [compost metagenome]
MGEHITAQATEQRFKNHDAEQADGDHVQGGQAAVHQHLVHHHLEEQRGEQREYIEDEGHQQHFAEQLAVFDNSRDKPAEVETGQVAGQRSFGADQDQLAGPACV